MAHKTSEPSLSRPLGHDAMQYSELDFEMLINKRRQHQTK